jgi:hypothetical protein
VSRRQHTRRGQIDDVSRLPGLGRQRRRTPGDAIRLVRVDARGLVVGPVLLVLDVARLVARIPVTRLVTRGLGVARRIALVLAVSLVLVITRPVTRVRVVLLGRLRLLDRRRRRRETIPLFRLVGKLGQHRIPITWRPVLEVVRVVLVPVGVRPPPRLRGLVFLARVSGRPVRVRLRSTPHVVPGRPVSRRGPGVIHAAVLEILRFGGVIRETTSRLTVLDHGADYM